ncbi:hypothetical protein [Vibrio sp. OPT18]|uniref:hypothetical protein n=1 Tax=Vibrio sp. OPT18 TaxID=2778641 RepID=UPI0018814A94|nr:hypothetical protein [Vibrio sp. OPT18]MBE8574101.1 hypothetical protein [Vibrio sp. OPT18]
MSKAHSTLKILNGLAFFVKTSLIIASTQVAIFVFTLYTKFISIEAESLSFQQWQSIMMQVWESTTNNKVQMLVIVLVYLIITIPLAIKTHRESKSFCCQCTCNSESRSLTTVASAGKSTP